MTAAQPSTWASEAAAAIAGAVGRARAPWRRGLWLTARERYDLVPLPAGFREEDVRVPGGTRRIAIRPGTGRALLLLPGLYASARERLFVRITAQAASRTHRPIAVLEHRLAEGTAPRCGPLSGVRQLGMEAAAVADRLGGAPDALALSAGLLDAWAAPGDTFRRIAGFSGVRSPGATARSLGARPLVRAYFARLHRRAGLEEPFARLLRRLEAEADLLPPPGAEWLLVHAQDDPVVPPRTLDDLPDPGVLLLPSGGHLGFGLLAGAGVYVLPLLEVPRD